MPEFLEFLRANLATIVIAAVLLAAVIAIVVKLVRDHTKGKSSCGCGCENCRAAKSCCDRSDRTG